MPIKRFTQTSTMNDARWLERELVEMGADPLGDGRFVTTKEDDFRRIAVYLAKDFVLGTGGWWSHKTRDVSVKFVKSLKEVQYSVAPQGSTH